MAFVLGLRERKKLATRETLGFAALRLAVARGPEQVLVEDIAAAAGVSARTFNNYFAGKYEAMCAPAVDRAHRVADALRERPAAEPLWPAIIHAVLTEFAEDDEHPDRAWVTGVRLIIGAPALQGEYRKAQAVIQEALARAIAERTGRDLDTDMFARIMAGAVTAALDVAINRWADADPPVAALPVIREALRQLTFLPGVFPMDVPTQHRLSVPGATLHYEIRGSGPLLLCIPGGNGEAGTFEALAGALAERYTVVTFDRRGFSRSALDGPVDHRVELDAADAAALLEHLTDRPAAVLGSSSGAIVALELLSARADLLHTVVVHEPPIAGVLDDAGHWLAFLDDVHRIFETDGFEPAMGKFSQGIGLANRSLGADATPEQVAAGGRALSNLRFFLEHEVRQYPRYVPDLEVLRGLAAKLVLVNGRDAAEHFPARPNHVLAAELSLELREFPGDHVGYVHAPAEFATALDAVLTARTAAAAG